MVIVKSWGIMFSKENNFLLATGFLSCVIKAGYDMSGILMFSILGYHCPEQKNKMAIQ